MNELEELFKAYEAALQRSKEAADGDSPEVAIAALTELEAATKRLKEALKNTEIR